MQFMEKILFNGGTDVKKGVSIIALAIYIIGFIAIIGILVVFNINILTKTNDFVAKNTLNTEYIKFNNGWIADSPGFSFIEFDLKPLELAAIYPGFEEYQGKCKFNDCLHEHEPGCAVKKAIDDNEIDKEHYETYISLLTDLKNRKERY